MKPLFNILQWSDRKGAIGVQWTIIFVIVCGLRCKTDFVTRVLVVCWSLPFLVSYPLRCIHCL